MAKQCGHADGMFVDRCPHCGIAYHLDLRRAIAAGERKPQPRQAANNESAGTPPPPPTAKPCEHEGPIVRRWPSDCAAKVQSLSVRECRHPETPGECSRQDHAAHRVAGVRVCRGRGCPLTPPAGGASGRPPAVG